MILQMHNLLPLKRRPHYVGCSEAYTVKGGGPLCDVPNGGPNFRLCFFSLYGMRFGSHVAGH